MIHRELSGFLVGLLMIGTTACADDGTADDEVDGTETDSDTETSTDDATESGSTTDNTTDDATDEATESESTETTDDTTETETDTTDGTDEDTDDDGILDVDDNCPAIANPDQLDDDGDQAGDVCDNCLDNHNPDQGDFDMDLVGDLCDAEVVDDGVLYVPEGAAIELSGAHCYTEIRIFGHVSVTPWDGMTGGRLELTSTGSILIDYDGRIDAVGAGRRGGLDSPMADAGGFGGEGMGRGCGGGPGYAVGQAGSGAGYGGSGGTPNNDYANGNPCEVCSEAETVHCEGTPGAAQGTQHGIDIDIGSGGGAGGNSDNCTNTGAPGSNGGGAVLLAANDAITINGWVLVASSQPPPDGADCGFRPGGGGGSGGALLIAANLITGEGWLDARGGRGGDGLGWVVDETWGWGGGGGGGGRIKFFGTEMFDGLVDIDGGPGGAAPMTEESAPGSSGTVGSIGGSAMIPVEFTDLVCD